MRFFLDTEFIERGPDHPIALLSIGIVADNGAEYYAEVAETDRSLANDWVKANVLPKLTGPVMPRVEVAMSVRDFVRLHHGGPDTRPRPEFVGYFCDYDWVVFCQLFGSMIALPKGFPMFCHDLKQRCVALGDPRLPEQGKGEHHALADARWIKEASGFLDTYERTTPAEPIPLLIWCPGCGKRHIDEGEWSTRVHHTHSCQFCGHTFRPAVVPTVGARFLPGFKNPDPEAPILGDK